MKKIIAATAGLMLLGAMATTASAATINFTGDARARFYYKNNYALLTPGGSEETYWQSRVRLVFKIETKGGAYAVGRFRLMDTFGQGWDGGGPAHSGLGYTNDSNAGAITKAQAQANFRADIAYVGIPFAGGFAIEAGTGPNTMDRFFRMDAPYNWIRGKYSNDASGTTVVAFMEKFAEYTGVYHYANVDDDVNNYGLRLTQKFGNDWLKGGVFDGALFYLDDQQGGQNGYGAVARVSGTVQNTTVYAGGAFKSADYQNWLYGGTNNNRYRYADRNGYGFFLGAKQQIGIAAVNLTGGMTFNSFTASGDFGEFDGVPFVMIGNGSQNTTWGMMNTGVLLGSPVGNAWFVNLAPSVKVSDKLTLIAEATYANIDLLTVSGKIDGKNVVEVGGIAQYQISDGTKISAMLGYLNVQDAEENPLGFGISLDLAF